jgi:hypothetical protein
LTVKESWIEFPLESVPLHVTVVGPRGNCEPDAGLHERLGSTEYVTIAPEELVASAVTSGSALATSTRADASGVRKMVAPTATRAVSCRITQAFVSKIANPAVASSTRPNIVNSTCRSCRKYDARRHGTICAGVAAMPNTVNERQSATMISGRSGFTVLSGATAATGAETSAFFGVGVF